jgi:hypothetical protein
MGWEFHILEREVTIVGTRGMPASHLGGLGLLLAMMMRRSSDASSSTKNSKKIMVGFNSQQGPSAKK